MMPMMVHVHDRPYSAHKLFEKRFIDFSLLLKLLSHTKKAKNGDDKKQTDDVTSGYLILPKISQNVWK